MAHAPVLHICYPKKTGITLQPISDYVVQQHYLVHIVVMTDQRQPAALVGG